MLKVVFELNTNCTQICYFDTTKVKVTNQLLNDWRNDLKAKSYRVEN